MQLARNELSKGFCGISSGWERVIRFFFVLLLVGLFPLLIPFSGMGRVDPVEVDFFYSQTCPHCAEQKPLMEAIDQYNSHVLVHSHEVNQEFDRFKEFLSRYQIQSTAVPRTFIGDVNFIGYSSTDGPLEYSSVYAGYIGYRNQIIAAIEEAAGSPIQLSATESSQTPAIHAQNSDGAPWGILFFPILYGLSYIFLRKKLQRPQWWGYWTGGLVGVTAASLFALIFLTPENSIRLFASNLPFPLFVTTIAAADGFNPCAFTVLVILLSLLTHTRSRRDMTLLGMTFIITSGIMYFIFILAMILVGSVFFDAYKSVFLVILGLIITAAGLVNIKDFFYFKQGISLSLSQKEQVLVSRKASQIVRQLTSSQGNTKHFLVALLSTITLAVIVNVIELGCTAILPVVYMTSLLDRCSASTALAWLCWSGWTGLYALIYIVPLLMILGGFIYSLKSFRLTEQQGKILKLITGLIMLAFGIGMLLKPELLILS
jgi:glutaredoxin